MLCPLCNTPLPDDATSCTRCDWVLEEPREKKKLFSNSRDSIALVLSLVPGLGHLYKGHVIFGGLIFFLFSPAVLAIALVIAPGTLGVSLLILPLFLGAIAFHAFNAEDRRLEVIERARMMNQTAKEGAH